MNWPSHASNERVHGQLLVQAPPKCRRLLIGQFDTAYAPKPPSVVEMYDLEGLAYGMKTRTRGSLFLSRISGRLLDYLQKPLAAVVEDTVLFSGKSKWNVTCGLFPQRQAVAPASEGCYDQVSSSTSNCALEAISSTQTRVRIGRHSTGTREDLDEANGL